MAKKISLDEFLSTMSRRVRSLESELKATQAALSEAVSAIPEGVDLTPVLDRLEQVENREPPQPVIIDRTVTKVEQQEMKFDTGDITERIDDLSRRVEESTKTEHELDLKRMRYRLRQPDGNWSPWYSLVQGGGGWSKKGIEDMINEAVKESIDTLTEQLSALQPKDYEEALRCMTELIGKILVQNHVSNVHLQAITDERINDSEIPSAEDINP